MSYVALDDRFPEHPKILQLTDREHRVFVALLCYCARNRTEGAIPPVKPVLGMNTRVTARLLELELLEENGGELRIHDYADYNGTRQQREAARERKRRQRERDRGVTKA